MKVLLVFYAIQVIIVFALVFRQQVMEEEDCLIFCLEDVIFSAVAGLLWPVVMAYGILCFFFGGEGEG